MTQEDRATVSTFSLAKIEDGGKIHHALFYDYAVLKKYIYYNHKCLLKKSRVQLTDSREIEII